MDGLPKNLDVKVVVLTLRQSTDRQARIKKLLDEAGIEFEFFWGVDGRKDSDPLLSMYNESKRLRAKGKPMTPGQLGCFASHYHIWQNCVRDDKRYVVLEDDTVFDEAGLHSFLRITPSLPSHFECLRLFENKTRNHKEYELTRIGPFKILRYIKGPMSTMGYYITPEAARKYLVSADPVFLPVDIYMDRYWVNNVSCLGVKPAIVFHDFEFESIIGYEKKNSRRPLLMRVNRELFQLSERIRRFFYNFVLLKNCESKRGASNG